MSQNTNSGREQDPKTTRLSQHSPPAQGRFPNTRWSIILSLGDSDPGTAADALSDLCQAYWFPLYAYARRQGNSHHQAEDLTQAFFCRLLDRDLFAAAQQEKGRLRSFLLTLMKRFMANEWNKDHAQKRGGDQVHISIDQEWAEDRYRYEPADGVTPEDVYERQWALTLLDTVLATLHDEYVARNKEALFETLKDFIALDTDTTPYASLAGKLDMQEGTVRVAVHRLRKRYRDLLTREIERTVESPEEIEDEMRHLFAIFQT
jgi:RNA polymerase sigma factor (sigma-70 family)